MLRIRLTLALVAMTLLVFAAGCSGGETPDSDSGADSLAPNSPLISPVAQGAEETPPDVESEAPTSDQIETAGTFLKTLDLPSRPTPAKSVEVSRLLGLCAESFGFELVDRDVALETGLMAFWGGSDDAGFGDSVSTDPMVVSMFITAYEACKEALVALGGAFPEIASAEDDHTAALYKLRVEEFKCLAAHGLATTKQPPLAQFLRSADDWSPWDALTDGLAGTPYPDEKSREAWPEYFDALDICPRLVLD